MKVTTDRPVPKLPEANTPEPDFTPRELVLREIHYALADREGSIEDDDDTPLYQWAQQISSQITKAQSGSGPFRIRYLKIAALAIAAIESIDRNEAKS